MIPFLYLQYKREAKILIYDSMHEFIYNYVFVSCIYHTKRLEDQLV